MGKKTMKSLKYTLKVKHIMEQYKKPGKRNVIKRCVTVKVQRKKTQMSL